MRSLNGIASDALYVPRPGWQAGDDLANNCSVRVPFRNSRATGRPGDPGTGTASGIRRVALSPRRQRLCGTRAPRSARGLQFENQNG